ncbi:helix-turn-helix domain-containing protein [Streptomyces sp. NPDC057654]|uniref:helix-turn-helix domain-containing protein n=1 Tax=Streptomyces sp. NPDC057654 TaxID=3346196 RepID=UPI00367F882C
MARPIGATAPRVDLGIRLRYLRNSAGLTLEEVAKSLDGLSYDQLRRIEVGQSSFRSVGDLRKVLGLYGVAGDVELVSALEELQKTPPSQDWMTQYRSVSDATKSFAGIESAAQEVHAYHPNVILGLLQTEEYAWAQFREVQPIEETTSEFIEGNVALRMKRREPFLAEEHPTKLWVILGEAALRHPVGDASVMLGQYEELLRVAALPHVTLQVLLTDVPGRRLWSNFTILDLGKGKPTTVTVDTGWGPVSMSDKPANVSRFRRWFSTMTASAQTPEETPEIIEKLKREKR